MGSHWRRGVFRVSLYDHRHRPDLRVHAYCDQSHAGGLASGLGRCARRSAYNAGINVRRTVFFTYVVSVLLCSIAAYMYAARLASTGAETGMGMEMVALTAAILGGTSLGGGRGSAAKALLGGLIVLFLSNGLIQFGIQGGATALVFGLTLLLSVIVEVRWTKNRTKLLNKVYVSPAYSALPAAPETAADSASPYAQNNRLREVELIGLGDVEGPKT